MNKNTSYITLNEKILFFEMLYLNFSKKIYSVDIFCGSANAFLSVIICGPWVITLYTKNEEIDGGRVAYNLTDSCTLDKFL